MEIVVTGIALRDPSMQHRALAELLVHLYERGLYGAPPFLCIHVKPFERKWRSVRGNSQEKNLPKIFAGGRPSPASASGTDSLSSYPVKHRRIPTTASNCRLLSWSIMECADSLSAFRSMRLLSPIRMLELEMPEHSSAEVAGA